MPEKTLPKERDLLIRLLNRVENVVAAANRLYKWLVDRINEEQRNWEYCVENGLSDEAVFERLAAWGITVQGIGGRFDDLADRLSNTSDPLDRYLPDETPPTKEEIQCFADIAMASPLELRGRLVLAFIQYEEKVSRKRQLLYEFKERIEAQLR